MITTIRIKDNSIRNKNDFSSIPNLIGAIADKTTGLLEKDGVFVYPEHVRESDDISYEQIILKSSNESFKTGNLMGFIGMGQERLIIQSRFSSDKQDFFLQYMLERVLDLPNILDLNIEANQDSRPYNLLLFIFPYYLKTALRKGLFKTYIRRNYNDVNIKGTIDIAEHIKKNTPFLGKLAYSQRELSFDNHLMELVRHTIELIKTKPYGKQILGKVRNEVDSVIEVTGEYCYRDRSIVLASNKKKPVRHAYYHEYRALQNLCIMLLQHEKHQIGSGISQIHGILFDGSWLWEQYVGTLIHKHFHHPMNNSGVGRQYLFTNSLGNKEGYIYPDFLSKNANNRIIADAKYKPAANIKNADYFQLLAYMYRFDSLCGYYLYPEKAEINHQALYLNQGSSYEHDVQQRNEIWIVKCGLKIPAPTVDYLTFKEKMNESEDVFKSRLFSNHRSVYV